MVGDEVNVGLGVVVTVAEGVSVAVAEAVEVAVTTVKVMVGVFDGMISTVGVGVTGGVWLEDQSSANTRMTTPMMISTAYLRSTDGTSPMVFSEVGVTGGVPVYPNALNRFLRLSV